ncbi:MAG TPA: carboxypeptidase M32 [Miltoncostaeaceae bacterium]|nr:carboxypeptidase M32 [Miltoncostaeaceae bacterium]
MPGRSSPEWTLFSEWTGTLTDLAGTGALLGWDRETLMPPDGAGSRARLLGTIAALHHRELVRADAGEAIDALRADDRALDDDARAMLRLAARARDRAVRVPEALVREITEACSRCVSTWIEARKADDFAAFAPPLRTVVALKRRQAEAIGGGDEPYDALLDEFEPGARAAELEPVFAGLRERLTPLVAAASRLEAAELPPREWSEKGQMALAHDIAALVGFDEAAGVIARSAHPFTSSPHAGDVRFTTRLSRESPLSNIGAVMHELGHALYEQGLPADVDRTPLHDAPSLGAHESQSRFWENQIGHTLAFWEVLEPDLRRRFPEAMTGLDPMLMHRAARVVRPSLIRVEADEVTYNLHIVLRFELELALIRGDLEVEDLPGAFADGMERLLGIRPPSDAMGAMQDIHWADGLFGYFPTYTLGNLYAAQLAEAAEAELGGIERTVADGRLGDVLAFMRERVHRHGARMETRDLMREATGRELGSDALIAHLERSYLAA